MTPVKGRYRWGRGPQHFLACMGLVTNTATLVNFPYNIMQYGFWPFFTVYVLLLLALGPSMIYLESLLGQFSNKGSLGVWKASPFFNGVGICMLIRSALVVVRDCGVASYALYYLFLSMFPVLQWSTCRNNWNSKYCWDGTMNLESMGNVTTVFAFTDPLGFDALRSSPVDEYFTSHVDPSDPNPALGYPRAWIVACLVMIWAFLFASLMWGIKSLGKVVWASTLLPLICLVVLLIRGVTLQNGADSIISMFSTQASLDADDNSSFLQQLANYRLWYNCGSLVIENLLLSYGVYATLSSYNGFTHGCLRDTWLVVLWSFFINVLHAVVIYSYAGFYAYSWSKPISSVDFSNYFYLFKLLPEAVMRIDIGHFFSICYYLMIVLIFFSTSLILVENIKTSLCDQFPRALGTFRRRVVLHAAICIMFVIAGLPTTTKHGFRIVDLIRKYEGVWQGPLFIVLQCIAFGIVYNYLSGVRRMLYEIIKQMLGRRSDHNVIMDVLWVTITPLLCSLHVAVTWWIWVETRYREWDELSKEDKIIELSIYGATFGFIPLWMLGWCIYRLVSGIGGCCERCQSVFTACDNWTEAPASSEWEPTVPPEWEQKKMFKAVEAESSTHQPLIATPV